MLLRMVEQNTVSDHEIHIKYEDQEKINQFARYNNKLLEIKDDLVAKSKQLQNLNDANQDVEELELSEDSFPFQLGEVFVEMSGEQIGDMITTYKNKVNKEISGLKEKAVDIEESMKDLKGELYGKFGSAINLEYD